MEKFDGFILYRLGAALHPLTFLKGSTLREEGTAWGDAHRALLLAEPALDEFLQKNPFKLRVSLEAAKGLLVIIRAVRAMIGDFSKRNNRLDLLSVGEIERAATNFINVIKAEMPTLPLYFVSKKGGNDTDDLIEHGEVFFPPDLGTKVPTAIADIQQGARCIAFDLPTAAGYHFHRANEAVLRRYWDVVTSGATPPGNKSAILYLDQMVHRGVGDPKVIAALRDLVKLHRNPLAHPDQSLADANEAIALMNSIHGVVVHMLKAIP